MVHQLTPGELFVKSRLMRNGYFIANKEISKSKNEWTSTGDLVYYDTYRCFHIVDRIRDLIKFKNKLIAPSKTEGILMNHPLVKDAVVVPIGNGEDGQHSVAFVTVKENEDVYRKDLEDWVSSRVPEEEQLELAVKIVGSLPHTRNGRIDRKALCSK